jgi:hypothetical protein
MLNYQIVCNDPDGYDPGGRKGYGFISFLSKGTDWYREEANPLAAYKKRKDTYPGGADSKRRQQPEWDEEYNRMMRESPGATA